MFSAIIEIPSSEKTLAERDAAKHDGMILGGACGVVIGLLIGVVLVKIAGK